MKVIDQTGDGECIHRTVDETEYVEVLYISPQKYDTWELSDDVRLGAGRVYPAGMPLTEIFPNGLWMTVKGVVWPCSSGKREGDE